MVLTGVFACPADADRARRALLEAGIDADRVTLSVSQTLDGLAAEAPGQSYENQPGQSAADSKASWYATAVRSGDCALSVEAQSRKESDLCGVLMREHGARQLAQPGR